MPLNPGTRTWRISCVAFGLHGPEVDEDLNVLTVNLGS